MWRGGEKRLAAHALGPQTEACSRRVLIAWPLRAPKTQPDR